MSISSDFLFFIGLNGSLIIFIRTYTVNYRNALDRLRVRMNIILFVSVVFPSLHQFPFRFSLPPAPYFRLFFTADDNTNNNTFRRHLYADFGAIFESFTYVFIHTVISLQSSVVTARLKA